MALQIAAAFLALSTLAHSARQDYDVHKIIEAFRRPRWNGTTENSHDAYFRASQAGIECIETDIHISLDGQLPMIHDKGLGRETDVGEFTGRAAYNPYTGQGYNPAVADLNFTGFIEHLHLRDEAGRVHEETVPTLPDMVQNIHKNGANVVLQLDFKDKEAVEPAYWALKNLTNAAGVPANEWCIYKLQAAWWQTPEELEAQAWMRDALENGVRIPYIPVYQPADEGAFDTLASLKAFMSTNYTISAEIELYSKDGPGQELVDWPCPSSRRLQHRSTTPGISRYQRISASTTPRMLFKIARCRNSSTCWWATNPPTGAIIAVTLTGYCARASIGLSPTTRISGTRISRNREREIC
ncbi:hypothetical protein JI435_058030 [Parastagonospora nodorum SN15]|uniref:GP-PDE domain-containing protein n=1 Tax=Phaeosphaeria nodorum (strain SN15 / ATCC MYA-4574 / FGSC 10173) TaxID=321614 RepID=A0A7U2NP94_PHANO|nr:hypothetical protein JI435_058030 [Parastagonospora nodorum SN15]